MKPVRLLPRFVERVWGATRLSPWFSDAAVPTGEVWFTADDNPTSEGISLRALMERDAESLLGTAVRPAFGGRFPILVKFLFTREKLSIQVHPDDTYGEAREGSPGKTEMWYVLHAEPDATIAAGFRRTLTEGELRGAVADGSLEQHVHWWPASAGQSYFVPASTVHAVGAGLVICEIQQNSDITYRLWDYGRPRELHVDKSVDVAALGPYGGPQQPVPTTNGNLLAACPYFATEQLEPAGTLEAESDPERFHLLVATRGSGTLSAAGATWPIAMGECWLIPAGCGTYAVQGADLEILRVYVPA